MSTEIHHEEKYPSFSSGSPTPSELDTTLRVLESQGSIHLVVNSPCCGESGQLTVKLGVNGAKELISGLNAGLVSLGILS